uniref:Ig-like domain-containing protein n=2 Tax=Cyprinus carpio TaxID=7962 RepID=A0A8C1RPK4_CYPCA
MKRKTEKEKMSEYHLCLLGLIALSSLLTGASGVDDAHVFISSGGNVRLRCNNALHDCRSTTWLYNRFSRSAAVELIGLGIKKKDTQRHERLSLGSDCSLNINNISTEDYGSYMCRQYVNHKQQGTDARVYLHVLHVSQTEISAGLSVTLFCQLYSYPRVSCDDSVGSERIELFWVNQAGVKLTRSDSRYQISSSSGHCVISLTTTLLNEDHNREWRCEVTQRDRVKTSVTYTVKSSVPVISSVIVISAAAASAVFLAAVLWLICRKRADNKRQSDESVVKDENEDKVTYETINMSTPAAARDNEQTDDVTYSEVSCSSKKPVKSLKDQDDSVTYAAIRGTENEPLGELYASVNKSCTNPDS